MNPRSQEQLLSHLESHGVPFVVIGGHAVGFHGYVRATEDVDVMWLRSADGDAALFNALAAINAQSISDEIDPATGVERTVAITQAYIAAHHLMMLVTDHGFLDLFDYVPGFPDADVREVYDQSIQSGRFRYVSLAWLRKMKQTTGRPKDLLDLENLPGA